ncbi:MAG: hypothetical protein R3B90_03105 [Planctomycetaceae bacterium]
MNVLALDIVWQPYSSPMKIGAGAVMLVALTLFASGRIFRERPKAALLLAVLRLGVIAAVSLLLLGPSRELQSAKQQQRPRLSILLDTSESMQTGDSGGSSRIEWVANAVLSAEQLARLSADFEIQLQGFDSGLHSLDLEALRRSPVGVATGRATNLAESTAQAIGELTSGSGDALLVLSDGRDTEDAPLQPVAALAAARGVPVYTVGVGGSISATDATLLAVPMQESLLPGEPGGIQVKVYQTGLDGKTADIQLTSGGETQQVPLTFDDGPVSEARLTFERDEPGQYELEVTMRPLPGEAEESNNAQVLFVDVMARRIRVLLLEGQPFWDSKFVAQTLRKDEQVELTQITQVGTAKTETIISRGDQSTASVPQSTAQWADFDIVLLGRGVERLLTPAAAEGLRAYVSDVGGHVVFLRGPAWSNETREGQQLQRTLEVLEPVEWSGEQVEQLPLSLTSSGRTAAWFSVTKMGTDTERAIARLPGFETLATTRRVKAGTLILARAEGAGGPTADALPAIVRMPFGRGQVVAFLGEGLWRWSLLPPELEDLRGFYETFWSNLVRWLALGGDFQPGQQVSLQLSRSSVRLGDELIIDVVCKQLGEGALLPALHVTGPDGQPLPATLHPLPGASPRFRTSLRPEAAGVYEVQVDAPGLEPARLRRKFSVYEINLERLRTSSNFLALSMLAEHSGGEMFEADEIDQLADRLGRHRLSQASPPRKEFLWDHGALMTLLLLWAGAEWLFRRAVGLW